MHPFSFSFKIHLNKILEVAEAARTLLMIKMLENRAETETQANVVVL